MKMKPILAVLAFIVAFYIQLLGMLNLVPILLSTPLLFIVLFLIVSNFNSRKRFKGFNGSQSQ